MSEPTYVVHESEGRTGDRLAALEQSQAAARTAVVAALNEHVSDSDGHVSEQDRAGWNAAAAGVGGKVGKSAFETFNECTLPNSATQKETRQMVQTILAKLKAMATCAVAMSALGAFGLDGSTAWEDVHPTNRVKDVVEMFAPAPGDYATVSNRAMTALQAHQSLEPATNYANSVAAGLAPANHAHGSIADGTNTVYANLDCYRKMLVPVVTTNLYNSTLGVLALQNMEPFGSSWANETAQVFIMGDDWSGTWRLVVFASGSMIEGASGSAFDETITIGDYTFTKQYVAGTREEIRYVGRLALTNDIPAVVRELSLGGIWDSQLEVWWTPRMRNGSLTYEATTNVNLNAEY